MAALVARGADPRRILLLTFSRRAAQEMIRRATRLLGRRGPADATLPWAGTFHAIANRLLRHHATEIGLDPAFTLLDREDAADLLDRLRHERALSRTDRRFPRKGTCLAIYSSVVNTQETLRACLETRFPWCLEWEEPLRGLFAGYVEAKTARAVLDYDDLLLYWFHAMDDASLARRIGALFDHVLVDEYQDTNTLQAEILRAAQARRPRRDRGRRRRAGDLQLPRRARRQHPGVSRAVRPAGRDRDPGDELPLDGADS